MKQLAPQVYAWSQYQPDRRTEVHGHFLCAAEGEAGVMIDPVALQQGDPAHLAELDGVQAILLTGSDRAAQAADCAALLNCPVLAPRSVADQLPRGTVEAFDGEASLPAGVRAIPLRTPGRASEVAYFHPPTGSLVLGDAVVGAPAGQLSLRGSTELGPAARALRPLLAVPRPYRMARLLVGEGQSILGEPARAIQDLLYRHDPMACLLRQEDLQWGPPRTGGRRYSIRSAECSRLLGLTAIDFEMSGIAPGCENYPLHRHDGAEELFIVLEGEGEVRTEHGAFAIGAGDLLGFPPRYQVAHAIKNTGASELRLLSFAARAEPLAGCDYPDSGQRAEGTSYGKSRRFFLPARVNVGYWEGVQTE